MNFFQEEHLAQVVQNSQDVSVWFAALQKYLPKYEIDTPRRVAAFVAQCGHESGGFRFLAENLNYRAESLTRTWPRHFPSLEIATEYERQPERIANRAYANRMGNGDEASGDGWKFIGRGLIQLTGRNNYQSFADSINMTLDQTIEHLKTIDGAVESACWFWKTNNINQWADVNDLLGMTRRINGGTIGLEDRQQKFEKMLNAFGEEYKGVELNLNQTLQVGSRGPEVRALQEKLGAGSDGIFGKGTEGKLKEWQAANGLTADGIAGPITLNKLLG